MFEDTLAVTCRCCGDGCRMVVMRLHGAVIGVPRITTVEVDGWVIPPGTVVFLSLASANRDETVFDEPLGFDITAQRPPHLSFGGGPQSADQTVCRWRFSDMTRTRRDAWWRLNSHFTA